MRRLVPILVLLLLATACGSESTTNSTFERIPTAIAFDWVNAVAAADAGSIASAVEPQGLVLVAAAENAYSLEETAALLQEGMSVDIADAYWATFREEFSEFAGTSFLDLEVGVYEEFAAGGGDYAVVTLRGDGASGTVVTSKSPDGWLIDMAATIGPAFAAQIRALAEQLDGSPASGVVAAALGDRVLPALMAAAQIDPTNQTLMAEISRIERALADQEESG